MNARLLVCALAAALLCGCAHRPRPIVVGSKNYTEQLVLGEIVAQHLERRLGQPVERQLNLGPTLTAYQALLGGQVDVYPEYSGAALANIFDLSPEYDSSMVFERVRQEFERQRLVMLPRLGYTRGMVAAVSPGAKLATLSDASTPDQKWVIGADYDFLQRPDGFPLLMKRYGLRIVAAPQSLAGASLYRALDEKRINMALVSDTDGRLGPGVKTLPDDRHAFPPYDAALVVRADALDSHPGLREALLALSGKFTHGTVANLNREVDANGRPPSQVAAGFLRQAGLNR